ncbi:putative signal transducing protein [Ideonella sp. YS5]|uniref:putative signal transducing protein n=1 Tax=Ideonella sp. YS5 TaxID=3453714 RepID=UPI003EEBD81D
MKSVFEASNTVEAHMVLHLLRQHGLAGRVEGEYLTGAMGDLPVAGLLRVVVEEPDYDAARAVVAAFEAEQPRDSHQPSPPRGPGRLAWAGMGLALGIVVTAAALRIPAVDDGIDHDRDGLPDERLFYSASGQLLRVEIDRNLDHRVDAIVHYERGMAASEEDDDDFDGRFETRLFYRHGNLERSEVDADGDGLAEWRAAYRDGVLDSATVIEPSTGLPLRVEHYRLGRLTQAEQDDDRDGRLDTRLVYGPLGQVTSREPLP